MYHIVTIALRIFQKATHIFQMPLNDGKRYNLNSPFRKIY